MVINENNSQINSFTKGMNSDTSFDQIENTQYIFGLNIRIAKNQPLGTSGDYSSVHEGIVTPVPSGVERGHYLDIPDTDHILAVHSSSELYTDKEDPFAIIITTNENRTDLNIYKIRFDSDELTTYPARLWWHCDNVWPDGDAPDKISSVLYKELENVIKLYIATGRHPIVSLRVDRDCVGKYRYLPSSPDEPSVYINTPIDKLINNRELPEKRIYINEVISGRLMTSQVLYTYRYYNKYGNTTQLAPLTNKIQIIDPSRTKEVGNAENTETAIGLSLKIDITNYKSPNYERLQVFRLSYIIPGQDAEVSLIYDGEIKEVETNTFLLNDVGIEPLQTYSMEEFAAMSGLILIPLTIEQNQEYMFCANVKDDTIIKEAEKVDPSTIDPLLTKKFEVISADVVLSDVIEGDIPNPGNHPYSTEYLDFYVLKVNNQGEYTGETYVPTYIKIGDYFELHEINKNEAKASYNNIMTSSLLRSLRRGEEYKYAIVFYDNKGRRTDVINLCDVITPKYNEYKPFSIENNKLIAHPIGVNLQIPYLRGLDDETKIIGCLIIRRSSSDVYQNTLILVALSRPISLGLSDVNYEVNVDLEEQTTKRSPYYPTGFLTTNNIHIHPGYYCYDEEMSYPSDYPTRTHAYSETYKLYLIFSSEIDYRRQDVLSRINISDTKIQEVLYVASNFSRYNNNIKDVYYDSTYPGWMLFTLYLELLASGTINIDRISDDLRLTIDQKLSLHWIFNFYKDAYYNGQYTPSNFGENNLVNQIKDVKIPEWNSGFSEIQRTGKDQELLTAIRKYKSYSTNTDSFTFNNWVSFGKYDLRAGIEDLANMKYEAPDYSCEMLTDPAHYKEWVTQGGEHWGSGKARTGFIGPGSSCFILTTKEETGKFPLYSERFHTSICNITHTPKNEDVESDEFVSYYGFGNFFRLIEYQTAEGVRGFTTSDGRSFVTVFDGDIYITPHELTTMYKAYDFNSADTLLSTQIVNYIPLESKVNTCFDYGMNLVNTNSENLMYEPGYIDGVNTQDRPAHLYNMIYSDNDASNDVFTLISTDKKETNEFRQRAYYSDLKTNGEFIDNFLIFKTAAFIDVDSRYGEITNLLTDKNMLYYWQLNACGKFSVNERSLVNDQNNNTIMLGQAGILSRYDYLSTKYGMRLHDFCARAVDNGAVFWVDINNKAIPAISGNGVINYGELANVLNIINNKITTHVPYVDYDLQNDELLCKCLSGGNQLVFNTKYNIATSIYTRKYDDMLYIKNHIYGLYMDSVEDCMTATKYNYLPKVNTYLSPIQFQFVVNPMASITKVFDSQLLVPIKRALFTNESTIDHTSILTNVIMSFETDIINKEFSGSMEPYTDREGNIIYNIPRYNNELGYGNRIRGKWLRVNINNEEPTELFTISHILTKFRQSYS